MEFDQKFYLLVTEADKPVILGDSISLFSNEEKAVWYRDKMNSMNNVKYSIIPVMLVSKDAEGVLTIVDNQG